MCRSKAQRQDCRTIPERRKVTQKLLQVEPSVHRNQAVAGGKARFGSWAAFHRRHHTHARAETEAAGGFFTISRFICSRLCRIRSGCGARTFPHSAVFASESLFATLATFESLSAGRLKSYRRGLAGRSPRRRPADDQRSC